MTYIGLISGRKMTTDIQGSKRMRQIERGGSPISKCRKIGGEEFKVLIKFMSDITNHDVSNPVRFTKLIKETRWG